MAASDTGADDGFAGGGSGRGGVPAGTAGAQAATTRRASALRMRRSYLRAAAWLSPVRIAPRAGRTCSLLAIHPATASLTPTDSRRPASRTGRGTRSSAADLSAGVSAIAQRDAVNSLTSPVHEATPSLTLTYLAARDSDADKRPKGERYFAGK